MTYLMNLYKNIEKVLDSHLKKYTYKAKDAQCCGAFGVQQLLTQKQRGEKEKASLNMSQIMHMSVQTEHGKSKMQYDC